MATVFLNKEGPSFCSPSSRELAPQHLLPLHQQSLRTRLTLGTETRWLSANPTTSLAPTSSLPHLRDFSLPGTRRCHGPAQQRSRPGAGVLGRRGCPGQVPFAPGEEEHFVKKFPWADMLHFPANNRARYTTA